MMNCKKKRSEIIQVKNNNYNKNKNREKEEKKQTKKQKQWKNFWTKDLVVFIWVGFQVCLLSCGFCLFVCLFLTIMPGHK